MNYKFPLQIGNEWIYRYTHSPVNGDSTGVSEDYLIKITADSVFTSPSGVLTTRLRTTRLEDNGSYDDVYVVNKDIGLFLWGTATNGGIINPIFSKDIDYFRRVLYHEQNRDRDTSLTWYENIPNPTGNLMLPYPQEIDYSWYFCPDPSNFFTNSEKDFRQNKYHLSSRYLQCGSKKD